MAAKLISLEACPTPVERAIRVFTVQDQMPLNETDKAWVRQEIQAANTRVGTGKLTGFLKDWGGFGAAVAVILFMITQWSGYVEFRTHTQDDIKNIQGDIAKLGLTIHASLSQSVFEQNLPQLKSAIVNAEKQDSKVPAPIISALQQKLSETSSSAPDFWSTTTSFISYRSQVLSSKSPSLIQAKLPNCAKVPLQMFPISNVLSPTQFQMTVPTFENCQITLDSSQDTDFINKILLTVSPFVRFKHCLVIYNGGNVNIILYLPSEEGTRIMNNLGLLGTTRTKLEGQSVTFEDCLFQFSASTLPPPSGQKMTESLLAQNENLLTLQHPE